MSSDCFAPVRNRLGFGCMRFPVTADGKIDETEVTRMVDRFIEKGFNYFDTAHGYLDGRSETTLRHCLTSRHDRSAYLLADKLSNGFFEKAEDIIPLFDRQLERCGVSYFDYYLMHALNARTYSKYVSADAFRICAGLREEGYTIISVEQTEHSVPLQDFRPVPGVRYALVFGNEVSGVSQEVVDASDFSVEIPQFGTKHSLNVSVSVGVVLWQYRLTKCHWHGH